jgi:hypothetical protein
MGMYYEIKFFGKGVASDINCVSSNFLSCFMFMFTERRRSQQGLLPVIKHTAILASMISFKR